MNLHSKVASINVSSASIAATKDRSNPNSSRELSLKSPLTRSTIAGVAKLAENNIASVRRSGAPLSPTLGVDDIGHGGILNGDTGIGFPGTTEIDGAGRDGGALLGSNVAVVQDVVAGGRRGGAARGSHVAESRGGHADVAAVEPGFGALAEDEVGVALDVGFGEDLVAGLGENGVLVSDELAGVVSLVLFRALVLRDGFIFTFFVVLEFVFCLCWEDLRWRRRRGQGQCLLYRGCSRR